MHFNALSATLRAPGAVMYIAMLAELPTARAAADPLAIFCSHIALPKTTTVRAKCEFPRGS